MQTTTLTPDPTRCPLCGGDNRCAMEIQRETGEPQPPCWCTTQSFGRLAGAAAKRSSRQGLHLRGLRGAVQRRSARMMGWLDRFPLALLFVVALVLLALRLARQRHQRRPGP